MTRFTRKLLRRFGDVSLLLPLFVVYWHNVVTPDPDLGWLKTKLQFCQIADKVAPYAPLMVVFSAVIIFLGYSSYFAPENIALRRSSSRS